LIGERAVPLVQIVNATLPPEEETDPATEPGTEGETPPEEEVVL
jgi:hypothetical protein